MEMTDAQAQRFLDRVYALSREETKAGTIIDCGDGLRVMLGEVEFVKLPDGQEVALMTETAVPESE